MGAEATASRKFRGPLGCGGNGVPESSEDPLGAEAMASRRRLEAALWEPISLARLPGVKKEPIIPANLARLLASLSAKPMTPEARTRQVVSIAFGNLKIENDRVTRGMIDDAVRAAAAR